MNYERRKHFPFNHSVFVYIFNNLNLLIFVNLIFLKFILSKNLQNSLKVYAMILTGVEFIHIKGGELEVSFITKWSFGNKAAVSLMTILVTECR
jgi:hypothetical protein